MEVESKKVKTSEIFEVKDVPSIYDYGEVTFGVKLADIFFFEIYENVRLLETQYLLHPECRHLETKTKIYRNIILGSYLIIYRIKPKTIEVLRAFHCSRSPKEIKKARKIKM
jgi:toxin ParE1/3/4